jgi:bifunctional non-homologous end joining protein LigD
MSTDSPLRVAHRLPQPRWIPPMLATLVEPRALPKGWIYEPKLDGVRCLAFVRGGTVHLFSRNRKPLDDAYPEIVEALARAARGDAIFDGEIVAIDPERGVSSFALLQQRIGLRDAARARASGVAVEYHIFDCLWYEGADLRKLPLVDRKRILHDAVRVRRGGRGPIRLTPVAESGFEALFADICARGGEGLIGKRAESRYVSGRSKEWVKLKCVSGQEFVVGGYTEPRGSRESFGALLVGYYEGDKLRYAGKVGTGYDRRTLESIMRLLARLERKTSPFAGKIAERGVHWVTPKLVVQIGFSEWTPDGLLRHPRFLGIREDKTASEVRRERATATKQGA